MNTKSIIEIFRGDDSDALGYQTIVGTIHTDLDLTGCKAVFRYLGFFQEFDPIPEDGKLTIVIPSASSMQFPPGFGYASLKVYDIDRKVRTFTNRIPVFVKTMTPCRGGGEFDVEFSPFPELAPLKIFKGPNADDFDLYTGFISKIIDRASAQKYGLSLLFDAMDAEKTAEGGCAASPAAIKAAYDAIIKELTDNYYTAEQTDEAIDKLAAYYITSDTQGNPFATHAALVNATTYYSGGSVRVPTRNDYAIVVADETHNNEEWRYIYSENDHGIGQWEPQYAVEGVITFDDNVTRTSGNGVKSSGIWSMIWGALSALPTGFASLYDWVVSQLAGKASTADATLTARYDYGEWDMHEVPAQFRNNDLIVGHDAGGYYWHLEGTDAVSAPPYATEAEALAATEIFIGGSDVPDGATITRTVTTSYVLGPDDPSNPNRNKPLASEVEAVALRTGKLDKSDVVAPSTSSADSGKAADAKATGDALALKANDNAVVHKTGNETIYGTKLFSGWRAYSEVATQQHFIEFSTSGVSSPPFAILFQNGNANSQYRYALPLKSGVMALLSDLADYAPLASPAFTGTPTAPTPSGGDDSTKVATTAFVQSEKRYTLPESATAISTASSEVVSGETVYYGAATLADRTQNQVAVLVALDELRVTIPPAVSGKVRDFGLVVVVGLGEGTAIAAPALVPIAPTGETITMMNAEGEMPTLADGTTTASGLTVLYFTEIGTGAFLVKGEQIQEVA